MTKPCLKVRPEALHNRRDGNRNSTLYERTCRIYLDMHRRIVIVSPVANCRWLVEGVKLIGYVHL